MTTKIRVMIGAGVVLVVIAGVASWRMGIYHPPERVLRIGAWSGPPFEIVNADGTVTGLGADVMIARESLSRPWIFAQVAALLRGEPKPPDPSMDEQRELVLHHYDLVCKRFGVDRGTLLMRKFACSYAQGLPGAREFRGRVSRVLTHEEFLDVMRTSFPSRAAAAD